MTTAMAKDEDKQVKTTIRMSEEFAHRLRIASAALNESQQIYIVKAIENQLKRDEKKIRAALERK